MHYFILTYGSRGDVQPFVALAIGLQKKGHRVTLAAPENFKSFVESYGVDYFPLHGNIPELLHTPEAVKLLKAGNSFTVVQHLQRSGDITRPKVNEEMLALCHQADAIITSTLNFFFVAAIAEKLQKKWALILPNPPATPTREFPFPDFDFINFPLYNLLSYRVLVFFYWQLYKKRVNAFRVSLGMHVAANNMLHTMDEQKVLTLYNFSEQLIQRPADWEPHYQITGFMYLPAPQSNQHDLALVFWLQSGEAPVYIGFGSIPVPDPGLLSAVLNTLLTETSHRIILCKGWSKLTGLPNHANLFVIDQVAHEWLLPQCKTAVFHGGAGTLAAVMKAKIPAIIVSIFGDQPMWGKLVARKKIGVHIPFRKLTAQKLIAAIDETQTALFRKNASDTGEKVNAETGVDNAVDQLSHYFG